MILKSFPRFVPVLVLAALPMVSCAARAAGDSDRAESQFSEASALYREGRWSGAYGRFAHLADQGHAEAARIAMHMLRMGPTLYQTEWGASQPQIDNWSRMATSPLPPMVSVAGD
jgi:hypothetical protein